jgi:hypothetical protein
MRLITHKDIKITSLEIVDLHHDLSAMIGSAILQYQYQNEDHMSVIMDVMGYGVPIMT